MDSPTLEIPAYAVSDVREGLFLMMSEAVERLDVAIWSNGREMNPEWFESDRRALKGIFGLLDTIGWSSAEESGEVAVDLARDGRRVCDALAALIPCLDGEVAEADANDARRADEGKPARKGELIAHARATKLFARATRRIVSEAGL